MRRSRVGVLAFCDLIALWKLELTHKRDIYRKARLSQSASRHSTILHFGMVIIALTAYISFSFSLCLAINFLLIKRKKKNKTCMRQKCEEYATIYLFVNAGGFARGEQETPSWRRESWSRYYPREETDGRTKTTNGRTEKTDRGTGEVRRSES